MLVCAAMNSVLVGSRNSTLASGVGGNGDSVPAGLKGEVGVGAVSFEELRRAARVTA